MSGYSSNAFYGPGTGKILLSGLSCSGYESSLLSCSRGNSVIGTTTCLHSQDASVTCYGPSTQSPTTQSPTSMCNLGVWETFALINYVLVIHDTLKMGTVVCYSRIDLGTICLSLSVLLDWKHYQPFSLREIPIESGGGTNLTA